MLSKVPAREIYLGDYGWHVGRFHFAFADYHDPKNTCFGDLMTFNDFTLQPCSGFECHPHQEIEIISYCLDGELVHEDDLGNKESIERGDMQYTCAGSGITHSERNDSPDKSLRFIQIWVRPNAAGLTPHYHSTHFKKSDRLNKILQIASGQSIKRGTRINQDTNIFVSEIQAGRQLGINQLPGRQVYLACLEGALSVNNMHLNTGDALKVKDELGLTLTAIENVHIIMVEMPVIL
jgi:quercetin 2,3-dioxygenase